MGRPRKHQSAAEKNRLYRLRKRDRALAAGGFLASVLRRLYQEAGHDVGSSLVLPWLRWTEVERATGLDIRLIVDCAPEYIEFDRSGREPMIRIGSKEKKNENGKSGTDFGLAVSTGAEPSTGRLER